MAAFLILAIAGTSLWLLTINEHEQIQRDARDER